LTAADIPELWQTAVDGARNAAFWKDMNGRCVRRADELNLQLSLVPKDGPVTQPIDAGIDVGLVILIAALAATLAGGIGVGAGYALKSGEK
jgi:hypothetical protein